MTLASKMLSLNNTSGDKKKENKSTVPQIYIDLIHISLVSFLWEIGKQCRPRSGSPLFDYRMVY